MKYFSMYGRIDKEMLETFIQFYNENQLIDCTIVLNTGGGDTYIAETIIHMINEMPKATLLIQAVYSSGFSIACNVNCKKLLSKVAKGMWHYGKAVIDMNSKSKPYYNEDRCMIRNLPIDKKVDEALAKKVMTPIEYKDFLKGEEVYFDFRRMKQIFPDAKVLK